MPIREYQAKDAARGCAHCARAFDVLEKISDQPLAACPRCGAPVTRLISAPSIGGSKSAFDARAKAAGFSKLERLGKGEYEKKY
jgi:putative FmdB family regulatory protein